MLLPNGQFPTKFLSKSRCCGNLAAWAPAFDSKVLGSCQTCLYLLIPFLYDRRLLWAECSLTLGSRLGHLKSYWIPLQDLTLTYKIAPLIFLSQLGTLAFTRLRPSSARSGSKVFKISCKRSHSCFQCAKLRHQYSSPLITCQGIQIKVRGVHLYPKTYFVKSCTFWGTPFENADYI